MSADIVSEGVVYSRQVIRATWYGIVGNLFLVAIKLVGSILSHSSALMADALHSLSDVASSSVVLLGVRIGRQRPDARHPYGHGKAESIAAGVVALVVAGAAAELTRSSITALIRFRTQDAVPIGVIAVWVLCSVIVLKEGLFQYKSRLARKIRSPGLTAEAWHHRSDVYSSLAALVGIVGAVVGGRDWRFLDQVSSLVVVLFILVAAYNIFRGSAGQLMDEMPPTAEVERIRGCAATVEGVRGVEKIFARRMGRRLVIDIHIEVEPNATVRHAHVVAQKVRDKLVNECRIASAAMVHIEPYYAGDHDDET